MSKELTVQQNSANNALSIFEDEGNFQKAFKMAEFLSKSDLVPATYKGKPENTIIALEMAQRVKSNPFAVMQNLNIIQGKPSWSSAFIISIINSSGRFLESLKFAFEGEGNEKSCYAYTKDKDGNILKGPIASMKLAVAEGWLNRPSSKWKTMPDLMMMYRAAAFFGRLYVSDLLMGMHTAEEVVDGGSPEMIIPEGAIEAEKLKVKKSRKKSDEPEQPEETVVEAEAVRDEEKPAPALKQPKTSNEAEEDGFEDFGE